MLNNTMTGTGVGTGAPIDFNLGFTPDYVKIVNTDSATVEELEWVKGMAAASGIKTVTGTVARTKITTNGITPRGQAKGDTFQGFTLGADADMNVSGEKYFYLAIRNGPGSGR